MPAQPEKTVLITTELFAPGGVQRVSRDAMTVLSEDAPSLEVWTLRDAESFAISRRRNVTVKCAASSRTRLVRWGLSMARTSCDRLRIVVMHAHLLPVALPMQLRGASVTVMLHGVEAWKRLSLPERAALARADRIIANSLFTVRRFKEANPEFAGVPIDVCHLGLAPAHPPQQAAVDPGAALIVSRLSSNDRYKGHDALLNAWPAVRARVPDARLLIVGDGDDRVRLEQVARDRGIREAVQFLGQVPAAELMTWYERCAIFVLPSTREGFGLVYLEAMRAGKPCVACAGAADEIVEADASGIILQDQRPEPLAAALIRLYLDPSLRARLGARGRARWLEQFTLAHFAERFRRLTRPTRERAA